MLEKNAFVLALDQKNFEEALIQLQQGVGIPSSANIYDYHTVYDQILRGKGYPVLVQLLQSGQVEKDLYMLDKIDGSIYSAIIKVREPDPELLDTWSQILAITENSNDEVEGQTLLSFAIDQKAHPAIIQGLIDAGIQVDFRNQAEENLIHIAIKKYGIPLVQLKEYLDLFIQAGVDPNEANKIGQSPLHTALNSNRFDILEYLLEQGADPNQQDKQGRTPFQISLVDKGDIRLYQTLAASAQMDFDLRYDQSQSPFHEYLSRMENFDKENPELLLQLLEDGADLNSQAPYYGQPKTGWDWMAEKNAKLFQSALQASSVDVNSQDDEGNSLLHKVCRIDSNYDQNTAKETYRKVKILLDAGADASLRNNAEKTAMDLASSDNLKSKTIELLILSQNTEK